MILGKFIMTYRLCLFIALTLTIVVLGGCLGLQKQAPRDRIAAIHKIAIIPIEPPPLNLDWLYIGSHDLTGLGMTQDLVMIPDRKIQIDGKSVALISGILMVVILPEEAKRAARKVETLEDLLLSEGAWVPTMVLAQEAAHQIAATGLSEVTIVNKLYNIPTFDDSGMTFVLNWQELLRNWYNRDISPFEYRELKAQGIDGILEVGITNYGILSGDGGFGMLISIKLVDPSSGKVLGKSRDWIIPGDLLKPGVKVDKPFDNKGKNIKAAFTANSNKLINNILKDIGLIQK